MSALQDYAKHYTGAWLDRLCDHDLPNRITASDLVAVTTLGVDIPPNKSIWILHDGAEQITDLPSAIKPAGLAIWDASADLSPTGAAWTLWLLLKDRKSSRPEEGGGIATTKLSKLLAAKRPDLVPIHDSLIHKALFDGTRISNYWEPWIDLHRSSEGQRLRKQAFAVRDEAHVLPHIGALRIIDIAIWHWAKHHYGYIESDLDSDV